MPGAEAERDDGPCADEIRAALEHMAGSEAFRGSPQLVSFLRYVVEATLRGDSDRIKGYTIAVEALGRSEDFDPQADPIVRVEAMRLRRALARYYANGGKQDPLLIDLPLGSYVPAFRRNSPPAPEPEQQPAALPASPSQSAPPAAPEQGAPARPPSGAGPSRSMSRLAAAGALVLMGATIYAGLDFWFDFNTPNSRAAIEVTPSRASELVRPPSAFPVIYVGAFQTVSAAEGVIAGQLRSKLRDALARFDELTIVSSASPESERRVATDGRSGRYDLTASVEAAGPETISLAIRLSDISDDRVIFARTFQHPRNGTDGSAPGDTIVREVAVALAQPYGIIHSRERGVQMGTASGDQRYRCLLDSYEYWRSYQPAEHAQARDCLERATAADPSFAAGFSALTEIVLQEFRRDLNLRAGDTPPLERALRFARRAVELKPDSARAYQALMDTHFLRGEAALSLEAGERAIMLNPYNPNILASYGARLVSLGEIERGQVYLREAALAGAVRPGWHEFFLFLAAYLLDDRRSADTHAALIVPDRHPLGYLARALIAERDGKLEVARNCFAKLVAVQPGWRDDALAQARKTFPSDRVALRLTHDLARAAISYGQ